MTTAPNFEGRVQLIPQNKEKYISFKKFIDSLRFLPSSLNNNFLFKDESVVREKIRSRLYKLHTEQQRKIALPAHDDKRYLIPNSTITLPWEHYRIPEENEEPSQKRMKLNES